MAGPERMPGATPAEALPPEVCIASRDPVLRWGDRYVLVEQIGEGGLGTVWKAWDRHLEKFVAIKRIRGEFDAAEAAAFLSEGRIVSRLHHPNIATVFDIGIQGNEPFIVMQLIEGRTLADAGPWNPSSLASALVDVTRALDYSHRHGVLHQDLKPENVMIVASPGESERVIVLDFGISRLLGGSTRHSGRVGTPGFMSPEQESGDPVDVRGDVFGLGATFRAVLKTDSSSREAGAFIKRCVARKPDDRFSSMEKAGQALIRLARQPVRRKRAAILLVAAMLLLVASVAVAMIPTLRQRHHDRANAAAMALATDLFKQGRLEKAYEASLPASEQARDLRSEIVLGLSGYETAWERRGAKGSVVGAGFILGDSQIVSATPDGTLTFQHSESGIVAGEIRAHEGFLTAIDVSPDGLIVAVAGADGVISTWRADSKIRIRTWSAHNTEIHRIRFSPDGRFLASGAQDGSVRLWPLPEGPPTELPGPGGAIHSLAFTPDGSILAGGGEEERIFVWSLKQIGPPRLFHGDTTRTLCLAFTPDGRKLIAGYAGDTLQSFDLSSGQSSQKWMRHLGHVADVVSLGGPLFLSASGDGCIGLWDAVAGRQLAMQAPYSHAATCLAASRRRLVTGYADGTVRLVERRWEFGWGPEIAQPRTISDVSADGKGIWKAVRFADSEVTVHTPGGGDESVLKVGSSGIILSAASGAPLSFITMYRLEQSTHRLKALLQLDGGWIEELIDPEEAGAHAAAAIGVDGLCHVLYQTGKNQLRYARRGSEGGWHYEDLGPMEGDMPEKTLLVGAEGPEIVVATEKPYQLVTIPAGPGAAEALHRFPQWNNHIKAWRDSEGRLHALVWNNAVGDLLFLSRAGKETKVRRFTLSREQVVGAIGWSAPDGAIEIRWITANRERIRTARLAAR